MALSPEWKNLPRRKCDDCGKSYKPTRPRRVLNGKEELGFCCDNCRKSYHKHGGAYRKLKGEMQKMIEKEFAAIHAELKELRVLWIETEERYVELAGRLDVLRMGRVEIPQNETSDAAQRRAELSRRAS